MKFEIRSKTPQRIPACAITEVHENGAGTDIAWFFSLRDAELYLNFLNRNKQNKKHEHPITSKR